MGETATLTEDRNPEQIRSEVAETRAALGAKLNLLEEKVKETVDEARTSVQSQVETVKKVFDLEYQIRARPWIWLGAAALVGFYFGRGLLDPFRRRS